MTDATAPATLAIAGIALLLRGDAAIVELARAWLQTLAKATCKPATEVHDDIASGRAVLARNDRGSEQDVVAPVASVELEVREAGGAAREGAGGAEPKIRDVGAGGRIIESECFRLHLADSEVLSGTLDLWTDPQQPGRGVRHVLTSALKSLCAALLPRCGGVLLHCSAAAFAGRGAAVFCGKSGAGKSTILDMMMEGARPLADDLASVFTSAAGPTALGPWVYPTPFGREDFAARLTSPEPAPLAAGFALEQRREPSFERLAPAAAAQRLMPWLALPSGDRALEELVFTTAAQLARAVPWYVLGFTKDAASTRAIVDAALRDGEAKP